MVKDLWTTDSLDGRSCAIRWYRCRPRPPASRRRTSREHAKGPDLFDVAKYPTATYKGTLAAFQNGAPTQVQGELTLHGISRPLTLTIHQFLCKPHPMTHKDVCGADASATFNRKDYGLNYGESYGFKMEVQLSIQIEAFRQD